MESEDEYKSSEEDSGELLSLNSFSNYETYFNFEPCPIYRLNQQLWFKILYFLTLKDQKNLRLASKTIKNFVDLYEFQKYKLGPPRREEEREEEEEEDNNDRKPLIKKDKSKVPKNKKRKPVPPPKPSHFLKKFQKNETILEWLMFFLFILQVALIPLHLEKKILDNWFLSFIPTYLILVLMIIYSIFFNKYRMKLRKYNNDELIFLGLLSNTNLILTGLAIWLFTGFLILLSLRLDKHISSTYEYLIFVPLILFAICTFLVSRKYFKWETNDRDLFAFWMMTVSGSLVGLSSMGILISLELISKFYMLIPFSIPHIFGIAIFPVFSSLGLVNVCCLVFEVFVILKIEQYLAFSWIFIFIPLFVMCIIMFLTKLWFMPSVKNFSLFKSSQNVLTNILNTLIDYLDLTIIILFVGSCVVIPLWLDSIIPYITWEFLLLPFFFLTSYLIFLKLYYDKNVENTGVASLYDIKKSLTIFLLKQGRPVLTWLLLLWTQIFFVLVYAVLDGFYIFTPPYILLLPLGAMGIVFTIQLTLSVLSSSWQGKEFWLLKIYFLFIIFEAFLVLLCINLERNVINWFIVFTPLALLHFIHFLISLTFQIKISAQSLLIFQSSGVLSLFLIIFELLLALKLEYPYHKLSWVEVFIPLYVICLFMVQFFSMLCSFQIIAKINSIITTIINYTGDLIFIFLYSSQLCLICLQLLEIISLNWHIILTPFWCQILILCWIQFRSGIWKKDVNYIIFIGFFQRLDKLNSVFGWISKWALVCFTLLIGSILNGSDLSINVLYFPLVIFAFPLCLDTYFIVAGHWKKTSFFVVPLVLGSYLIAFDFLILKLNEIITFSWFEVFIPLWIFHAFCFLGHFLVDREVDIFGGVSPILALFELMLAFNFEHFNEFPMYILFIPLGFISIFLFVFKLLVTLKNKGYELQFLSVVIDILFIFLFILFLIPVSLRFYSESAPIIGFFIILFVRLAGDIGFDFSEKGFIGFLFQQEGFGGFFNWIVVYLLGFYLILVDTTILSLPHYTLHIVTCVLCVIILITIKELTQDWLTYFIGSVFGLCFLVFSVFNLVTSISGYFSILYLAIPLWVMHFIIFLPINYRFGAICFFESAFKFFGFCLNMLNLCFCAFEILIVVQGPVLSTYIPLMCGAFFLILLKISSMYIDFSTDLSSSSCC